MSAELLLEVASENRDRIIATFTPQRTDDLRPESLARIGWRGVWSFCWMVSEEDGGQFIGQRVWIADEVPWFGWCPECDLSDVSPEFEGMDA